MQREAPRHFISVTLLMGRSARPSPTRLRGPVRALSTASRGPPRQDGWAVLARIVANVPAWARFTSPSLASSRLATKVLVQPDRRRIPSGGPTRPAAGVVQIRVTRETRNPLVGAALATFGVTHKPSALNHADSLANLVTASNFVPRP